MRPSVTRIKRRGGQGDALRCNQFPQVMIPSRSFAALSPDRFLGRLQRSRRHLGAARQGTWTSMFSPSSLWLTLPGNAGLFCGPPLSSPRFAPSPIHVDLVLPLERSSPRFHGFGRKRDTQPGLASRCISSPAYCPHLNPTERLWGVTHKHLTQQVLRDISRIGSDAVSKAIGPVQATPSSRA